MEKKNELAELREKLERREHILAMRESLGSQAKNLSENEIRLRLVMEKENTDVEKLEKGSLSAAFYAIIGQREKRLEKEQAEAYAAAVKHRSAVQQLQEAREELAKLDSELEQLRGVRERYDCLFAEKLEKLRAEDPVNGAEICAMEDKLAALAAQKKEIDEAITAGERVQSQIRAIQSSLSSAESWGTWDLIGGGGIVTQMAKHSHLDGAQTSINRLQTMLSRYKAELADVRIHLNAHAEIDGFLRFADYFFDGLFADWAVQEKIHSAQNQIGSTSAQVARSQSRLKGMRSAVENEMEDTRTRLSELVVKA